jgi:uncharacterized protein (TIGR02466 family)
MLPVNMDVYSQKCLEMESIAGEHRSNVGGYQSQTFLENDFKNNFYEIHNFVVSCVNEVGKDTQSKYLLDNVWININRKNNYNRTHIHAHSSISGCIYLKTNSNSGKIVFENPTPSRHYNINDNVDGFFGVYWRQPVVGEVIIFPSYLPHYVEPNNNEEARISIAFNCNRI